MIPVAAIRNRYCAATSSSRLKEIAHINSDKETDAGVTKKSLCIMTTVGNTGKLGLGSLLVKPEYITQT